ncbi:ABC transporter permease [Streptococcus sanguinis]|uniref:ABC transporter permease n=1 Tax=Streptococcus sanguinis TaxID=1305 RepID=UPI002283EC62|nr:ABC transporter permease [Streptococcus sanguinis]MCY7041156.1 ABC transporter permease [Streptococcus sanguinis]
MLMLIKRNFLLYFRNRSGVILSLFGAIIPFVLYLVFLKDNMKGSWLESSHAKELLDFWLISGVLAVTGLTTTLAAFSRQVEDRERKVTDDLFITDLGPWGLQLSYLVSSVIIGFLMQVIMFAFMLSYFTLADNISFEWGILPYLVLLMLLNSLLATLINALIVQCFKSVDSLGKLATVVGATSGFLVGTYIPIGTLPKMAQNLMKLTPSNYMTSLFRQVLMKESLANTFANNSQPQAAFEKTMGIRIEWQELLTRTETFYIVGVVLVATALIWMVQNMIAIRRLKLQ